MQTRNGNIKRIFVTGVCGRLGRQIAFEATRQGLTVIGIDIIDWPAEVEPPPEGLEFHRGSYGDEALLERLMPESQAIVHTGGPHGGQIDMYSLPEFLEKNVTDVARMLELATAHHIQHVVLSSTMEVVIGRRWRANGLAVLDEQTSPRPDSAYPVSRLLLEQLGRCYAQQYGLSIASLRFMAFGSHRDEQLGPRLLARYLSARDAACATLQAACCDSLRGEVIHIGPDTPLTNADIAEAMHDPYSVLERLYPGATEVLAAQGCELHTNYFWPMTRIERARAMLGWAPQYTFRDWLKAHKWVPPRVDDTTTSFQGIR